MVNVFDYASIQLEKDHNEEFKECSIPSGVMALAESIIQQALNDVRKNQGRDHALSWIMANDKSYQFSFLSICSSLKIDPEQIRAAVNAFLAKNQPKKKQTRKQRA